MHSFIKAAHKLGIPRASVSAAIHHLETQLGTRLLHRTTRQVSLTADGAVFLARVRDFLLDANSLEQIFHEQQSRLKGRLNVDAPSRIARRLMIPALPGFLQLWPELQLSLSATDRTIDLVQEGVDCAIRVGELPDSSLVVKKLGVLEMINCASPAYLARYGKPDTIDELSAGHVCIGYHNPGSGGNQPWEYLYQGDVFSLTLGSQLMVDNAENYIACCLAGLGIIQIPRFDVQHLLDAGKMCELLVSHRPRPMPIALVYPHRHQRSRRLQVFMQWFETLLKNVVMPPRAVPISGENHGTSDPDEPVINT